MPRKTLPISQKWSNLLKISIFIAKLTKPIIPKLILLKNKRKLKKFKLLKHYNYAYTQEYQFSSSSNTPLIQYYHRKKKTDYRDIYSNYLMCACLGKMRSGEGVDHVDYPLEALPAPIEDHRGIGRELQEVSGLSDNEEEEESVDERAERFIERFYEEMRKQRKDPQLLQLMEYY